KPLLFSPLSSENGIVAHIKDIGEGSEDDFKYIGRNEIKGKVVLVRHSYMFSSNHVHRNQKYKWALEYGAVGFIIANPCQDSGIIAGGIMPEYSNGEGVPGVGVDASTAILLSQAAQKKETIRLIVKGETTPRTAESLFFDIPGTGKNYIAISAHLDGHDLAESAMDNAGGVAVLLELARILSSSHKRKTGYRFCFFNLEEWGMLASMEYLSVLSTEEKEEILLNINLDAVVGDPDITAIISDHSKLKELIKKASGLVEKKINIHEPITKNSDHYYFAKSGIPAFRLVAGFNKAESNLRFVLTENDKRDLVSKRELVFACKLVIALAAEAEQMNLR
ncbi:MAG: M28 family peptidase, partial [Proteobacteria bacterium]|nr:M28 family peptidase [Pseudomonadota bacterium]